MICDSLDHLLLTTTFDYNPYSSGCVDPTLSYRAVVALTESNGLTQKHYAGLDAELGLPMLEKRASNCLGLRLWLLKDPKVTWRDFAVALYNIQREETDEALIELKEIYLPNTGLW